MPDAGQSLIPFAPLRMIHSCDSRDGHCERHDRVAQTTSKRWRRAMRKIGLLWAAVASVLLACSDDNTAPTSPPPPPPPPPLATVFSASGDIAAKVDEFRN